MEPTLEVCMWFLPCAFEIQRLILHLLLGNYYHRINFCILWRLLFYSLGLCEGLRCSLGHATVMGTRETVAVVGLGMLHRVHCFACHALMVDNYYVLEICMLIGVGAMGLVTVKNLLEEGFDVTGFDRNSYIGGLWHFTNDEDTLSVLECKFYKMGTAIAARS